MHARFIDFAHHNSAEMIGAGGESLEVIKASVVKIALSDFFWCAGSFPLCVEGFFDPMRGLVICWFVAMVLH